MPPIIGQRISGVKEYKSSDNIFSDFEGLRRTAGTPGTLKTAGTWKPLKTPIVNGVGEVKKRSASAIDFCFFHFYFIGRRRISSMIVDDVEDTEDIEDIEDIDGVEGVEDTEDIKDVNDAKDANRQWSQDGQKTRFARVREIFIF